MQSAKAPVKIAFKDYPETPQWCGLDKLKSKRLPKSAAAPAAKATAPAKAEASGKTYATPLLANLEKSSLRCLGLYFQQEFHERQRP